MASAPDDRRPALPIGQVEIVRSGYPSGHDCATAGPMTALRCLQPFPFIYSNADWPFDNRPARRLTCLLR